MTALRIEGLTKSYGGQAAVSDLSLEVEKGELVSILGPSGCGKSTLLACVAGICDPDSGRVSLGDRLVYSAPDGVALPPERRRVGFVFQHYALWPHMTVEAHLAYPLRVRRVPRGEVREACARVVSTMRLGGLERRYPWQLSGGERQRVALGRAVIMEPELLMLDEPFSNLDARLREDMQLELRSLQRELGLTIVHVTHDQSEALSLSSRVAVMSAGRLVQYGTPSELYDSPRHRFCADFVGVNNIVDDGAGHGNLLSVRPEDIELCPLGRSDEGRATIVDRLYRGSHYQYVVQSEGRRLKVMTPKCQSFELGQRVSCRFKRSHAIEAPLDRP